MTFILSAHDLVKHYEGLYAVENLSIGLNKGEIHALIGPNGAGKSTAIALLAGEVSADFGQIIFNGMDITNQSTWRRAKSGIGHTYQITSVIREMSVIENIMIAMLARTLHKEIGLKNISKRKSIVNQALAFLDQLGLSGADQQLAGELSHGEQSRLEIAMCLATRPSVLLMDEPMSGTSVIDAQEMITLLSGIKTSAAILLVEHDMDAVFKLADRVSVMSSGQIIASGPPELIRKDPAVINAYLGDS